MTYYSAVLDKLEVIGTNTSGIEVNISSVSINTDELERLSEYNLSATYLVEAGTDNLSFINRNTSATLLIATSIEDNISYNVRFSGQVYHNFISGGPNASRFESSSLLLRDFVISCTEQDMALGDSSNQSVVLTKGTAWGGAKLNLNSLYFKNASANITGNLGILATRE